MPLMSCPYWEAVSQMLRHHLLWGLSLVPSLVARGSQKTRAAGERELMSPPCHLSSGENVGVGTRSRRGGKGARTFVKKDDLPLSTTTFPRPQAGAEPPLGNPHLDPVYILCHKHSQAQAKLLLALEFQQAGSAGEQTRFLHLQPQSPSF